MQEKLKEYGFASSVTFKFIADIFGKRVSNTFYAGLVLNASSQRGMYEIPPVCQPLSHAFIIIFSNIKPLL